MANILVPLAISAATGILARVLFPVKGQTQQGARVNTNDIPSSSYGQVIPKVYGVGRVTGQLIWSQPLIEVKKKTKAKGGKGGGSSNTEYQYFGSFAVLFAEGESNLYRLYIDSKLAWSKGTGANSQIVQQSEKIEKYFRFYSGTDNQQPDSLIQSIEGAGKTPAHRNYCYMVFDRLPLADYQNRIPTISAELIGSFTEQNVGDDGFCEDKDYLVHFRTSNNDGTKSDINFPIKGAIAGIRLSYIPDPDDFKYAPGVLPPDNFGQLEIITKNDRVQPQSPQPAGILSAANLGKAYSYSYDSNGRIVAATPIAGIQASVKLIGIDKVENSTSNCTDFGAAGVMRVATSTYHLGNQTYRLWYRELGEGGDEAKVVISGTAPFRIAGTPTAQRTQIKDATGAVVHTNRRGILYLYTWQPGTGNIIGYYAISPSNIAATNPGSSGIVRVPNPVSCDSIVKDLCLKSGLTNNLFDVTDLADILIPGFTVSSIDAARSHIEKLQVAYSFETFETDGKIIFKKESSAIADLTINPDYYLTELDGQDSEFEVTHLNIMELPREMRVRYIDREKDFQDGEQYARRDAIPGQNRNIEQFEAPLSLNADEAKMIASKLLFLAVARSKQYKFSLPYNYLDILPGDTYSISLKQDLVDYVKILKTELGANYETTVEAVSYDATLFGINIPAPSFANPKTDNFEVIEDTSVLLLDIPIWDENAGNNIVYGAAAGETLAWQGGNIFEINADTTLSLLAATSASATLGITLNTLGVSSDAYPDYFNLLNVKVSVGQLTSATELAWLNGANLALVGDEIVAFKNATLIADSTYQLSQFRRGLFGTDYAIALHSMSDRFVLLDGNIQTFPDIQSNLNLTRVFKGVTNGQDPEEEPAFAFANTGASLRPLSPVHIAAHRDGVGNIYIKWIPRTRKYSDWQDDIDAPINEEFEAYTIEIFNGANVVRTVDTNYSGYTYSTGDQQSDFGSTQTQLTVRVYQLSASVGRGVGRTATFIS